MVAMWAKSRDDLEETSPPIRIPIYRGSIGRAHSPGRGAALLLISWPRGTPD